MFCVHKMYTKRNEESVIEVSVICEKSLNKIEQFIVQDRIESDHQPILTKLKQKQKILKNREEKSQELFGRRK